MKMKMQKLIKILSCDCRDYSEWEKERKASGDYDIWYKPCEKCGYDTGKSTIPKEGNKTCWKCGSFVSRDYSDRALKKFKEQEIIKAQSGQEVSVSAEEILDRIHNIERMSACMEDSYVLKRTAIKAMQEYAQQGSKAR